MTGRGVILNLKSGKMHLARYPGALVTLCKHPDEELDPAQWKRVEVEWRDVPPEKRCQDC